jgi:hypothetical protein
MKWVTRPGLEAAETIGYEDLRAGTVRQVAQLMAAAAITAPNSGGQLFLAGKQNFMETGSRSPPASSASSAPTTPLPCPCR